MARVPPGPKGLPVVGNSHQYARDPFRFLTAIRDAYGDVARFQIGRRETYALLTPEGIERVLVEEEEHFRKPQFQTDAAEALLGEGLLMSDGPLWREMRTLAGPAFDPGRVEGLAGTMVEHAERTVDGWAAGEVRDVHSEMARVTVRIIADAMFGTSFDDRRVRRVQQHLEPLGRRFEPDPRRVVLPDWLPTRENREYRRSIAALERVLDEVVAERSPPQGDDRDLLSILLRARQRGVIDGQQVRDELMTMLLAGHDTTALALTYAWHLLAEHPTEYEQFHAELDATLDGPPTASAVRSLSHADRVLREAMRLYPPVYTLFRTPVEPVEVNGVRIPEDALVMLPQWALHRDPRYFDDPESFEPDRWIDPDHPTYAYFPFGAGPRSCIGKHLSLLEAWILLASVGRRYRLERVDDEPLSLRASLTMHPDGPVRMRLRAR